VTLSLALSAFALSLVGAAHCAAMCGGFVAASQPRPWALHAGRIGSYALIGGAIGAAGSVPFALASSESAHRVLFLVACAVLAVSGLRMAGVRLGAGRFAWSRALGVRAAGLARRVGAPRTRLRALALGALWGWAPCALVYAALPLALVSGSVLSGAIVMAAFGLGTLPALAGTGWLLARLTHPTARSWIGGAVVAMAALAAIRVLSPGSLPAFLCVL
jgi:sulfite exporter TauE/SafE